jgi:maleylpyruvate isomerase
MIKLYGYFRSSAAFRVRIALNLKGLSYENISLDLRKHAHRTPEYARINPQQAVPTLIDGTNTLTQSLAIIEYLEETHPEPALLPSTPEGRARARALSQLVACDIHPLNNLRVLEYLLDVLKVPRPAKDAWYHHWVNEGFQALEAMLAGDSRTGTYCHGDSPTIADICLVPQVFNAQRLDVNLTPYPTVVRIFEACMKTPAFDLAQPSKQPDAK